MYIYHMASIGTLLELAPIKCKREFTQLNPLHSQWYGRNVLLLRQEMKFHRAALAVLLSEPPHRRNSRLTIATSRRTPSNNKRRLLITETRRYRNYDGGC